MTLRLITSFCLCVPLLVQLACTACGSNARPLGDAGTAADAEPLAGASTPEATCGACDADSFCNSLGVCTPEAWECGPMYYRGGVADGCDCDCGVPDPDCDLADVERWCYSGGTPVRVADCAACGQLG